jgi:diadenosine tetraphosphate (Ap4A) HIT family hydrolase
METPEMAASISEFNLAAYVRRSTEGPCFVCAILANHPDYPAHRVYEDDDFLVFLARWPTLRGYTLVTPKRHVEDWTTELADEEFVSLQRLVLRVARAVRDTVPTERMYSLNLGSQQGNAHVHWHVAPLPPGIPYEKQQFAALMAENGVLPVTDAEQDALARAIGAALTSAP